MRSQQHDNAHTNVTSPALRRTVFTNGVALKDKLVE
jgi:hypothetical protein